MESFRGPDRSPDCPNCPCAVGGNPVRPIRGAGALGSLAIVGEGPSTEDLSQGWPMVGPSGKLLQQAMAASGIDRHSIWITNAILCQRPNSDEALQRAVDCCKPRLRHEIALVNPTAILGLGDSATEALELPVKQITQARGTVQQSPTSGIAPVVTTIHPGAILKGGGAGTTSSAKSKMNVDAQYVFLEADLAKAYSLALNPQQPLWQDNIELIEKPDDISCAKVMQFGDESGLLAIDLEWGMDSKITWLGLASAERAYSIYLPHMDSTMRAILKRIGANQRPKLFHNLQADVPIWEAQIGLLNGQHEDTMLMHHCAFPGAAHDLQNVASQFLLVPPWKADRRNEEKQAAKNATASDRQARKAAKQLDHQSRNANSAEAARVRKASRKAKHDARNTTAHLLKLLGD